MLIEIPDDAQDQLYAWLSGLKLPVAERRVEEAAAVILGVVKSWERPSPPTPQDTIEISGPWVNGDRFKFSMGLAHHGDPQVILFALQAATDSALNEIREKLATR